MPQQAFTRERVMADISIRHERPEDAQAIRIVNTAAFPTPDESRLVDALREAGHLSISLVAEVGGRTVGHIAFSPVDVANDGTALGAGLGPVAVLPECQGRGIGAALIRAGIAECASTGVGFVVLLGNPQYYERFGFRPGYRWKLDNEYGARDEFMALEIVPDSIPSAGGLVRYCAEFRALDEIDGQNH